MPRTEATLPEITLGETVCEKLKAIYFKETPWAECHKEVAQRFTLLKKNARKFYNSNDTLMILKELQRYSPDDLRDMFEHKY